MNTLRLTLAGNIYTAEEAFAKKDTLRAFGWRWDRVKCVWWTINPRAALPFISLAVGPAREQLRTLRGLVELPAPEGRPLYPPGRTPKRFQTRAIDFALTRNHCYLAMDPGLGKTIVAAMVLNALAGGGIYVCPAYMVPNVTEEMGRWLLPHGGLTTMTVGALSPPRKYPFLWIVSDSQISSDVFTANLTNLTAALERIRKVAPTLVVDEAQRFKTDKAERTQALMKMAAKCERVVLMSGTPMPNRPLELYSIVMRFAPQALNHMNRFEYARRFCAAKKGPFGWDFSGHSNLDELSKRLRSRFMLRMRKEDVLPELPPKTEELLLLDARMPPFLASLDTKLLAAVSKDNKQAGREIIDRLNAMGDEVAGLHVATYRRELGMIKAPHVAKYVSALLETGDENIILFAVHKDVVALLVELLARYKPLVIVGSTLTGKRHGIVKEFQTNVKRRLLIGNIQAAGVGSTLTKATRGIFAEYSWVPADNQQAGDRMHRIGQRNHVFLQYAVWRNSLDRRIVESLLRKRDVTSSL